MEELLSKYGWQGVAAYLVIKYGHIAYKKYVSGEWVSYKELDKRLEKMEIWQADHVVKEAAEEVRLGKFDSDLSALKDKFSTETGHIFSQLKSLHEKFDSFTKIMLEKK